MSDGFLIAVVIVFFLFLVSDFPAQFALWWSHRIMRQAEQDTHNREIEKMREERFLLEARNKSESQNE